MRILLFTRHYPPAVSGLAPRTSGLARALRAQGADVFVVAPSLPDQEPGLAVPHPNRDPPMSAAPPRRGWRDFARELLLWPDPDIRWCLRAGQRAAKAAPWRPDWVLSFSPCESAHVAALFLARKVGAAWAADFTDLWLENPHRQERNNPWRRFGEGMIARWLTPQATLATSTDDTIAAELRRFGVRNPQVLAHFPVDVDPIPVSLPGDRINVVHTGSFSLSSPENVIDPLLQTLTQALAKNPKLMMHLVGRLTDAEQKQCAAFEPGDAIKIYGPSSLAQARGFQASADALVFACPNKLHVPPSKVVEYLTFDKPIIGIGEGPWRTDPRVSKGDPVAMLASLQKGDPGDPSLPRPLSAMQTARQLLAWMGAAGNEVRAR